MDSALEVEGLTKRRGGRRVLAGVSLRVPAGRIAALLGPQGAGKTTMLEVLVGLIRPDAGRVTMLGEGPGPLPRLARRVGALVDEPAFYPDLTGRRNLELLAHLGRRDPADVPRCLQLLDLSEVADEPYRTFSMGTRQRLGIASALLGRPDLILLDEPSNGLDPAGQRLLRGLLTAERDRGATVLVSTHLLAEVERLCDWIIVLKRGRVLWQGEIGDLRGEVRDLEDVFLELTAERAG